MTLAPLLQASPSIQIHAFSALAAFALGAIVIFRRKGDRLHRLGGRIWVALMLVVAVSSFFIHTIRLWGIWSPIHLLSVATLASLVYAVWMIRRRNIVAHASAMRTTYVGALVIAGGFTLAPGRIMNKVVFGEGHAAPAQSAAPAVAPQGPGLIDIATGTPLWVWPLLAYLLFMGWRRMQDRAVSPMRLFVMPVVITGLAVYNLSGSALSLSAMLAFACGGAAGAFGGLGMARRRPAEWTEGGRLKIRGDWMPLALMLGVFSIRYVQGTVRAIAPAMAHEPAFLVGSAFVSGLLAAMMIARTVGQLPGGFFPVALLRSAK